MKSSGYRSIFHIYLIFFLSRFKIRQQRLIMPFDRIGYREWKLILLQRIDGFGQDSQCGRRAWPRRMPAWRLHSQL